MIDMTTPEGRELESKRVGLMIAQRHLSRTLNELDWLINNTPTGDLRNKLCDANIHAMFCADALQGMKL